ncbi:hypothetical protein M8C21_001110 [Ambrosia artemisiifolia]|uniref:Uncharacterized protein n=1 Tax=Ambrosia artemisiifolia TaxID=4212 RepID=A0AAD5G4Z6_AMBAR|nr:hypothetical protein M8C21_001110 [Ambrosia artemisiifolia]
MLQLRKQKTPFSSRPIKYPMIQPKQNSQESLLIKLHLDDNQPIAIGDFEQHLQFFNSDTLMLMHHNFEKSTLHERSYTCHFCWEAHNVHYNTKKQLKTLCAL